MDLTKAAERNGAMVALYPSPDVAETLAQDAGEPAEDLHLTLAFLGDASELEGVDALKAVVAGIAAAAPPLTGEVAGIGHFTAGPEPVTYASPDVPGLAELRQAVCDGCEGAGAEPSTDHGWTPHITLAYAHSEPDIPNLALAFNTLSLVVAGERTDYPLSGKQAAEGDHMGLLDRLRREHEIDKADYSTEQRIELAREGKAIPIKEDGKIVGGRYPIKTTGDLEDAVSAFGRAKSKPEVQAHIMRQARALGATDKLPEGWTATKVDREFTTPLWKDDAKQIVYGVVMQPDVPDSAGDWQTAETIERAAHKYLAESRKHDVQHDEQTADVTTVESFIAPDNMTVAGNEVLKGSWVMAVHVADPAVWGQVTKGELTGFSIGGTGVRVESD